MKKVILSLMVATTLLATGCKKAKEAGKDMKDATVEAADKAVDATKEGAEKLVEGAEDAVDATKEGAEKLVDDAKELVSGKVASVLEGIEIPEFSNPEVSKNLAEYAQYAKDYIAANGDLGKISAMAAKGKDLMAKGKELASKLNADELTKYKSTVSAIMSKMAPAK